MFSYQDLFIAHKSYNEKVGQLSTLLFQQKKVLAALKESDKSAPVCGAGLQEF